jgi:hypothetical protein
LLRLTRRSGHLANPEAGDFQRFERLTVLFELNPVPGDVAIAVSDHGAAAFKITGSKDGSAWLMAG